MRFVIGADEVGLGPLAGDVYVCAVMVPEDMPPVPGVTDSKKLSRRARERLREEILAVRGLRHRFARATPSEIDRDGIRPCHERCFSEAIRGVMGDLRDQADVIGAIRIDGNPMELPGLRVPVPVEFVVRGDASDWVIGAASILAKTERDARMVELADEYPGYGWARNVGYGTPEHTKMIIERGLTPVHRESFCRKILRRAEPEEIDVFEIFPPEEP